MGTLSTAESIVQLLYLISSILFIAGLRDLGDAKTARRGVFLAEIGMGAAVVGTLIYGVEVAGIIKSWTWIIAALILGFIAVVCSTINVVGGFLITDRMLRMFRPREKPRPAGADDGGAR